MPRALSAAAAAVALYVAFAGDEVSTGLAPAAVVLVSVLSDYRLWVARGRPWHDAWVIVLLLPGIAAAVWIATGGLAIGVERTDAERLLVEVGPGVALTGLLCTLVSYHGRHDPRVHR